MTFDASFVVSFNEPPHLLTFSICYYIVKTKMSKKLIGTDDKSNVSNYKFTNYVEICPLCKDDLLYLPAKTARNLGNISRLVLIKNISNLIHFLDPMTGQTAPMTADAYWRQPLRPIITAARSRMTRFVVLGKQPVVLRENVSKRSASKRQKSRLAELTLAKEDDLGVNDMQCVERSHVGYLMKSGDVCAGYDLEQAQIVDDDAEVLREQGKLPKVVILRKLYGRVATSDVNVSEARMWQLNRLNVAAAEAELSLIARSTKNQSEADAMDEEDFLQEVEADRDMRQNMNLYKRTEHTLGEVSREEHESPGDENDDDEDDQQIRFEELLDALALDTGPDDNMDDADVDNGHERVEHEEGKQAARDGIKFVGRNAARDVKVKDAAVPVIGGELHEELSLFNGAT